MSRKLLSLLLLALVISLSPISINQRYASVPYEYFTTPIDDSSHFTLSQEEENCLVPCGFILPVLSPDAIPSIDNPKFLKAEEDADTRLEDFVLGMVVNGIAYAFPLDILDWHEIVNAELGGRNIAVTYCPLTATGIPYDRDTIGGGEIGVSGKLYENNLVFYDRDTNQYWLQMYGEVIQGDDSSLGRNITQEPVIETTWRAWKAMHPDTLVLSRDTGIYGENQYGRTAYPGYDTSENVIFRSSYDENTYPDSLYTRKNRTLILEFENNTMLYPYHELAKYSVVNDVFAGEPIVIVFDELNRLAIPFSRELVDGTILTDFVQSPIDEITNSTFQLPVFTDSSGSKWNFKGEAIEGQYQGNQLEQITAYTGYWFAAMAMYPDAEIFPMNSTISPILNQYDWLNRNTMEQREDVPLIYITIGLTITIITMVAVLYANHRRQPK